MSNIFSISMLSDRFTRGWDFASRQAGYVYRLENNLEDLRLETDRLMALREDVKLRVEIEERQRRKRLDAVEAWLSQVEATISEVDELIAEVQPEIQKSCLRVCCSGNCKSRYTLGRMVVEKTKQAVALTDKGELVEVEAEKVIEAPVVEIPLEPKVGTEGMLHEAWRSLMEDQIGRLGIYGLGGMGKTTLMSLLNNKFVREDHPIFDVVIWVNVSQNASLDRIQEDIGKRLGFSDDHWKNRGLDEKAMDIFNVLRRMRFLLLLDDLWDRIDLVKVGVPLSNIQNGSKIVFTSRSENVCNQMGAQKLINVVPLTLEESWPLFQQNVGKETLDSDPHIEILARAVTKQCGGLPLALITVGRAMASKKSSQEWEHVLGQLTGDASNYQVIDKVYQGLKISYDMLPNDTFRSCLLYCTLFPEDFKILKDDLIDYWICEGFFDQFDDKNDARSYGYNVIGNLVQACLLEDEDKYIRMHNVIRDTGLWIAGKNFLVKTSASLTEPPDVGKWEGVRRVSLMGNSVENLKEVPRCPDLLTLFLSHNPQLFMITEDFFKFMGVLTVLDLSKTNIRDLPLGISKLVSLQYLNLSHTFVEQLPLELKKLVKLKYLNLEHNDFLGFIPREVVSSLELLQVLRMFRCGFFYRKAEDNILSDGNLLVEELQLLKHLNVLSITIRCASALESFFNTDMLPGCTKALCLEDIGGSKSLNISSLANMRCLDTLQISHNDDLQELNFDSMKQETEIQEPGILRSIEILEDRCFDSLREVRVEKCFRLRDLTWLILAPNLVVLSVTICECMEEIISRGKLGEVSDADENLNPFAKLEVLVLENSPKLKSIYRNALSFQSLKKIRVLNCPMLVKLPLNSNSAREGHGVVIEAEDHWWQDVQWEDEATKAAFLGCFTSYASHVSDPWE